MVYSSLSFDFELMMEGRVNVRVVRGNTEAVAEGHDLCTHTPPAQPEWGMHTLHRLSVLGAELIGVYGQKHKQPCCPACNDKRAVLVLLQTGRGVATLTCTSVVDMQ